VLGKKWAFKINAGFMKGYDWIADNKKDLNPYANQSTGLTGDDNPAYDPVNGYGNESSYRLWTNSKSMVHNYGAELDVRYLFDQRYSVFANGNYQALKRSSQNDGLEDGFNTPGWIVNAGLNASNILSTFGFAAIGASNIFNRYYYSILGGPQIGAMYYTTITYDLFNH